MFGQSYDRDSAPVAAQIAMAAVTLAAIACGSAKVRDLVVRCSRPGDQHLTKVLSMQLTNPGIATVEQFYLCRKFWCPAIRVFSEASPPSSRGTVIFCEC